MKIIKNLADLSLAKSVVALGTFDGLHLGHKSIVEKAIELAQLMGCPTVVFSFSSHPLELLNPDKAPKLLFNYEEKAAMLRQMGVDVLVSIPFDKSVSGITAHDFVDILCDKTNPQAIVIGENFNYGQQGKGNAETLAAECQIRGIKLFVLPLLGVDGTQASSTNIRSLILSGDIQTANKLLGRVYSLHGKVVYGSQIGRTIGFPTANISVTDKRMLIPAVGGYIVEAEYQGKCYPGIANIGFNPTVGGVREKRLEVHIIDFDGNIYGEQLRVYFHKYLCAEQKFADLQQLKEHIATQKELAKSFFSK